MDAVPTMPVEEHQVLDPGVVRQTVNEVELCDRGAASTPFLGVEFANPHEWLCARLLGGWVEFRGPHFGICSGIAT